jgi:excisionase family DNA binding protein
VGEQRPGRDRERGQEQKLTLAEAAEVLGLSKDGVRMRVRRGSLRSEKGEDGRRYVFVTDQDVTAYTTTDEPQAAVESSRELVDELRDRVRFLEAQLEQANERDRENRRIVAALTSRIPELEGPQEERSGGPETVEAEHERAESHPAGAGTQEGEQRSWWRRIFGS